MAGASGTDVSREVLIHVCADGTVTYRTRDEPVFNGAALPVYSVDTKEEAEALRVLACSRVPAQHPLLPGEPWYKLEGFGGELKDIPEAVVRLRKAHDLMKKRRR